MNNWRDHGPVSDEDLVAYLDGALEGEAAERVAHEVKLDRALSERLELLRRGARPFSQAYDALLAEAPHERLKEILKRTKEPPPPEVPEPVPAPPEEAAAVESAGGEEAPPLGRKEPWGGWRVLAAAAVLLAVFAGGLVASRFVALPGLPPLEEDKGWRAAVAGYQALFVPATLERADSGPAAREANLRGALGSVGLDLGVDQVSVAPLQFKRAEVFSFKGKPLVQIAYLMGGKTPVSFCIIKGRKPPHGPRHERYEGLNIVFWRSADHGFMVIGDVPASELGDLARALRKRLS